jgi:hypothetical protein
MFSNLLSKFEPVHSAYPVIKETVPQSALGYHANNKYHGFPPLMSDGRSITASWQPNAVANTDLIEKNGIQSNWQYRQYLQHNAVDVMKYNFTESSNDVGYYKRAVDVPNIQSNRVVAPYSTPTMYSSALDTTPTLGQTNSDLKRAYLTREQLDARRVSPVITQEMFLRNAAPGKK